MKIRFPLVSVFIALVLAGCGQKETAPSSAATAAAPAPGAGPREIDLSANDQMQFVLGDQHTATGGTGLIIEAKAGETLKIVLTNAGTLPKEAMGHNWVLLKPGSDAAAFSAAAAAAKDTDYVPEALKAEIFTDAKGTLAHIPTLGPRKSGEVTITVPAAGEYPFLCSFPAHFAVGMKGTLVVK